MSQPNSHEPFRSRPIQDIRLAPGYIPTYNRGNQSQGRNTIPGRKRQFNRVYHDSPSNQPKTGTSGGSNRHFPDENRPRK